MFFISFLFLIQFTNAQDPWIEWGKAMFKRCTAQNYSEDDCERLQDAYEEMFERVAITVISNVKISAYKLYQITLQTPYIVIGEHILDFSISNIQKHLSDEDKYELSIKDNMLGWLYSAATQDAYTLYKAIRDDPFYDTENIRPYLQERNVDIDELKSMDDDELMEYVKDIKVEL